jgi:ubiquinone/menaquinone biosynthesis C-methylase UbiE
MQSEEKRDFDKEAAQWDANPGRMKLAHEVADTIIREAKPSRDMDVLDFGCGTGLVTLRLQPLVRTILGADSSQGMLDVLEEKIRIQGIANARTCFVDFKNHDCIEGRGFHLIVSSMTLHHVPDTAGLFAQWHEILLPGGLLCFADLDAEDGSFHSDNTGVFHKGFDREHLKELLLSAGFQDVHDTTAATMTMDVQEKGKKEFPVFLIIAKK